MESVVAIIGAHVPPHVLAEVVELPARALHVSTWPTITLPHTFNTCVGLRPMARREHWLLNFAMTMLACVGGNLVLAVLTHTHPFFMLHSSVVPLMALVWWLVNFAPFDLVWRLYHLPPLRVAFQAVAALNRCRSVIMGFDKGRELFGGSAAGMCILALVAGLSGGLVSTWVKKLLRRPDDAEVATEFSRPTFVVGSAAAATAWLFAVEELRLLPLPGREARAAYVAFMVCYALVEPLVGTGFVPLPLSHLLHAALVALNIPTAPADIPPRPHHAKEKEKHA